MSRYSNLPVLILAVYILLSGTFSLAAQQATVAESDVPVYAAANSNVAPIATLEKDVIVTIDLRVISGGLQWCAITGSTPTLSGYVDCAKLNITAGARVQPSFHTSGTSIVELLDLSGFAGYIRHFTDPSILEQAMQRDNRSQASIRDFVEVFSKVFRPEVFLGPVRMALEQEYSPTAAEAAALWYKSAVGQRIMSVEREAVTAGSPQDFARFMQTLPANPPTAVRAALVERLYRVADLSEISIEMAISVTRSIGEILNPRLPPEKRLTEAHLQKLSAQVEQMRPMLANLGKARMAYLYRELSDDELQQYVEFWETPQGRWLRRGIYQGSIGGVRSFAVELAKTLVQLQEQRRPR